MKEDDVCSFFGVDSEEDTEQKKSNRGIYH